MKTTTRKVLLVLSGALILTLGIRLLLSVGSKAPPAPPPSLQVLVAARDLPAGLLLNSNAWTTRAMQQSDLPKGAIMADTPTLISLKGALLHNPVKRGMPLRRDDIISSDDPGFLAASLRPGMRAVSVAVNDVSGNAGLIQPGDYVDLILTQTLRNSPDPAHAVVSETIGQGLRVIAVGSTLQRNKDSAGAGNGGAARTVTLEVWPRGAAAIAVAAKLGDLSLALLSFATTGHDIATRDQVRMPSILGGKPGAGDSDEPVWAGDVSSAARTDSSAAANVPAPAGMTATTQNGVLILRGSAGSSTTAPNAVPPLPFPINLKPQ